MTISHRHSKQQNRGERYNSGEDGTNDEESSSMNKKKKRRTKGKKKNTNRNNWNICNLPTGKILFLISYLLAARSSVVPATSASSISASESTSSSLLFLVPGYISSNGEQHFRDWDHKSIW